MRKALFILSQLSDLDVDWLTRVGQRRRLSAGELLIREGEPADAISIVLHGRLAVFGKATGDRELTRLGSGEVVGEMSFVDSAPPSASVRAVDESEVLMLPREKLSERLAQDTAFAARFYRALAMFLSDRVRRTVNRIGHPGSDEMDDEVAHPDEIDAELIDNLHLAGTRFTRILQQLEHGPRTQ